MDKQALAIDLLSLANTKKEGMCDVDGELFVQDGIRAMLDNYKLHVSALKAAFGDKVVVKLGLCGDIMIKTGVWAEGYSYFWLKDYKFSSKTPETVEFEIDLSGHEDGFLEIYILSFQDSVIYSIAPAARTGETGAGEILYDMLFPRYDLCQEEPLYFQEIKNTKNKIFRSSSDFNQSLEEVIEEPDSIFYSYEDQAIHWHKDAALSLLTYFNAFSSFKWYKYTNVEDLKILLDFKGEGYADLVCQSFEGGAVATSWTLSAKERSSFLLELDKYPQSGILGVFIRARKGSVLYGGAYASDSAPSQDVRLGIGVTTYKREKNVAASVARLREAVQSHPFYYDKISIAVVDNGRTLKPEDVAGAELIPNRNLGGSGGFMRGLMSHRDKGVATHCLFMDDDAACEPGAVFRSMSFLRHAKDDKLAVSGAMLYENLKFQQWENGAWFNNGCHSLKKDFDLRNPKLLAVNERENNKYPIYGAWWFFMFPIKQVKQFSFPFFVRGDDIEFSYANDFTICTLNGVASWQEDFNTKESPQTAYFYIRSHIMHNLTISSLEAGRMETIKMLWKIFKRHNDSYQYDTAKNIVKALNGVMKGPKYWLDNMETDKIRAEVSGSMTYEKRKPMNPNNKFLDYADPLIENELASNIMRSLTFNGHLLPRFMLSDKRTYVKVEDYPQPERAFGRKKIVVASPLIEKQWVLGKNSGYYFENMLRFGLAALKFCFLKNRLQKKYAQFYKNNLREDKFWKIEFNK